MPSAELGGEFFARPARRSIETSSVMGLYEAGDATGACGEAGAMVSVEVAVTGSVAILLRLSVFVDFDWGFEDFLAIYYPFVSVYLYVSVYPSPFQPFVSVYVCLVLS